ncbi:ComEA family DNA-binding protein [Achromobacter insuavis]|uniref:ComEA family DNA-binding protein n=1 Tax=Achromobacter insuavis TaxID=1287735 RepID=UPI001EEB56BA|nr:DUF655 domain-containing protein [Achromobacter insuavis]
MNPFLHSTVARRLPALPWRRPQRVAVRRGAPVLRQALGVALLAAGVAHAPAQALDLNDATAQQLEAIRGIGPRTAQTIVSERDRAGKFESLQDLADRVRGISPKKAEALGAAGLTVGDGPKATGAKPAVAAPAGARSAAGAGAAKAAAAGGAAAKPGKVQAGTVQAGKAAAAPRP